MSYAVIKKIANFFDLKVSKGVYDYIKSYGEFYTDPTKFTYYIDQEPNKPTTKAINWKEGEYELFKLTDDPYNPRQYLNFRSKYEPVLYGYYTTGGFRVFSPEKLNTSECFATREAGIPEFKLLDLVREFKEDPNSVLGKPLCVKIRTGYSAEDGGFGVKLPLEKVKVLFANSEIFIVKEGKIIETIDLSRYKYNVYIKLVRFIARGKVQFGYFNKEEDVLDKFFSDEAF